MSAAGQTINDRILAARHSLAGQGLAKAVCKATTEEIIGPKKETSRLFAALHQRAKCVDPDARQLADRENPEPQLGGRLQGSHHHPPPHVLWQ